MLMFWGYFDDSRGDEISGESVALGGSIASLEGWCRLLPEWERIVADSGMGWFHATDWKSQETRLHVHWKQLIALINKHLVAHVGSVVPGHIVRNLEMWRIEAQRAVNEAGPTAPWEREWIAWERSPIGLCLAWCFALAVDITARWSQDKVALFFAETAKLQGNDVMIARMISAMKENGARYLGPRIWGLDPRSLVQLQVADLVAFEVTEYRRVGEDVRWQYEALRPKLKLHIADPPTLPDFWRL